MDETFWLQRKLRICLEVAFPYRAVHQWSSSQCGWLFFRHNLFKLAFFSFCCLLSNQLLAPTTLSLSSVISPLFLTVLFTEPATVGQAHYEKFLSSYELPQLQVMTLLHICHLLTPSAFLLNLIDKYLSYLFITLNIKLSSAPSPLLFSALTIQHLFFASIAL